MLAQSEFFELLQRIDQEFLGVVILIGTIGFFVTAIVTIVSVVRTINNITVTRMQHSMVKNLLSQGYSVDDVQRLAYGNQNWSRHLGHIVRSAKTRLGRLRVPRYQVAQPMPPVKQPTA